MAQVKARGERVEADATGTRVVVPREDRAMGKVEAGGRAKAEKIN